MKSQYNWFLKIVQKFRTALCEKESLPTKDIDLSQIIMFPLGHNSCEHIQQAQNLRFFGGCGVHIPTIDGNHSARACHTFLLWRGEVR